MIATDAQLAELLPLLQTVERIALDTEADSLHCYQEKLCLLQLSFAGGDYLVDPLASADLSSLSAALRDKEIVLQGADFDLRLLRRSLNFSARRVFDTVIAARLLGIREFSLAALVQHYFGITLAKGSQKANWAQRPLTAQMAEYALNDTRYLLPLAERLEAELREKGRMPWFRQSCDKVMEQSAVDRSRNDDEMWRISGAGALHGRAAAVLRALWHWRDREAQAVDRPAFHILQNHLLIQAAEKFTTGQTPDFRHFSGRRRREFLDAADRALQLEETEWPQRRRRVGLRTTSEMERKGEELRRRRDVAAKALGLEPSFIASRAAVDAIAMDPARTANLLVPWQQELLELQQVGP